MQALASTTSNAPLRKRRRAPSIFLPREDGFEKVVVVSIPAHGGDPARQIVTTEWARLPQGVFQNDDKMEIEILYQWPNDEWPSPVRIWRPTRGKWEYLPGSASSQHPDKPWRRRFRNKGVSLPLARLVLMAHDRIPDEDEVARHIIDVPRGGFGDDSLANVKWGTHAQNARDTPCAGHEHSNARPIRGKKVGSSSLEDDKGGDGVGEWKEFRTLDVAKQTTSVPRSTIYKALLDGKPRYGSDGSLWIFERFSSMKLETGEEWTALTRKTDARGVWRFCTSLGRIGEVMSTQVRDVDDSVNSRRGLDGVSLILREGETLCEIFPAGDHANYKLICVDGNMEQLSRIIVELLRPAWMLRLDANGEPIPWNKLDVDHIVAANIAAGEEHDNALSNLQVMTRREHQNKNANPVVELDAKGTRIPGHAWVSTSAAGQALGLNAGNIGVVCHGKAKTTKKRRFAFISSLPEPERAAALADVCSII